MIILSAVLVVLLLVALAYLRGRRKRYEMKEKYERQALRRERLSEMGNLAAGVAHEIRNPLNTISIAAQRLAKEFAPESGREQYEAFTTQIRTETKRLNEIITRFLALARAEKRHTRTVELGPFLEEVGGLLRVEGDRIGISVSFEAGSDIVIKADPDRLKEVFLNLFNNTKEALSGRPGKFIVVAHREGERIIIAVTDDGPGIPGRLHDRIFAPYYTSKEAGTGLGLTTVQRIISDLGGDVHLDEQYDKGARFVITIGGQ